MDDDARSATATDPTDTTDLQTCRLHGLLFDRTVTDECPLCEYERAERVARSRHDRRGPR